MMLCCHCELIKLRLKINSKYDILTIYNENLSIKDTI